MEKEPVHVMSLDSEDDDIEIVSENITNYGNFPTPVEVAPELQQKLKLSLEKLSSIPGKIKAIKVYAIKKKKNEMGKIKTSFTAANGKLGQVVNVGSVFDSIFCNQVKVVTNNIFLNERKAVQSPTTYSDSEITKTVKKTPQPDSIGPILVQQDERPLTPSSPVILYSPIRKGKQCIIRNESLQNVMPSNEISHKNGNSPNWVSTTFPKDNYCDIRQNVTHPPKNSNEFHQNMNVSLLPQSAITHDNFVTSQFFQYSRQERNHQDISEIEMNASENTSPMITPEPLSFDPLLLDKREIGVENVDSVSENLFVNICGKSNPVELSPIKFSSDEEEKFNFDNSILDIFSSPKSSHEECLETFPKYKLEDELSIDDMLDDMELDVTSRDFVGEEETKNKTEKRCHNDNENSNFNVDEELMNESENMLLDIEPELPKQNINVEQCKQFSCAEKETVVSKFLSVDVERLPKRMLKFNEKDEGIPPQWTTIFPPSPPTHPPPDWMASNNLWQLDATEFMEVTGLCGKEQAAEMRRQFNAPKPRVLRKKRHKM